MNNSFSELMAQKRYTFIVQHEDLWPCDGGGASSGRKAGKCRLDMFLLEQEGVSCSRSHLRKLILDGEVTVNGQPAKPGYWMKESDVVVCTFPAPRPLSLTAEQIPLDILFEDEQVIVLNKPAGMVVHPAPGHDTGTLVHALLHHCQDLSGIGGVQRPGIVHRLDRDTSGVMLVAKTDTAHQHLSEQLKSRELTRIYTAIVHGHVKDLNGHIEAPIGRHPKDRKKMAVVPEEKGRYALSLYRVVHHYKDYTEVDVELKTGRTHQIRVHMKHIHHPVVGDPVYGVSSRNNLHMSRQALHARVIRFLHPVSGEPMKFATSLPDDMQRVLEKLREMH